MTSIPVSLLRPEMVEEMCQYAQATPAGCFVELGVYQGGSAWHLAQIAQAQAREIYLYDTFTGIPYKGPADTCRVGDFADTSLEAVTKAIPYATIVAGLFPDSLVSMPSVAFAHFDGDQEESMRAFCQTIGPMMVPGGIMIFDDYIDGFEGVRKVLDATQWIVVETKAKRALVQF
jgi:hypothetical protein